MPWQMTRVSLSIRMDIALVSMDQGLPVAPRRPRLFAHPRRLDDRLSRPAIS
jgi:hypothetical protein